jgi:hypothetical protein
VNPEQRARLLAAKLTKLVDATAGSHGDRRSVAFPGGAALAGDDGVWVLVEADPIRSLGPALAVACKAGALDRVQVFVEDAAAAGVLARRASCFAAPPTIWALDGIDATPAVPAPLPVSPPVPPEVAALADLITAAGADPVWEHGRLVGEVEGLEVCRVEGDPPRLSVGVGRFDREANELLGKDSLDDVVRIVREHRHPDAIEHPLQRWSPSRWLRSQLVRDPARVGADVLFPMAPTVEAPDLRVSWPAPAPRTAADDGGPLVVVCSVGVDLDLVPAAADARLADGRDAQLVLAVPARDVHAVTVDLAAALTRPATVIGL